MTSDDEYHGPVKRCTKQIIQRGYISDDFRVYNREGYLTEYTDDTGRYTLIYNANHQCIKEIWGDEGDTYTEFIYGIDGSKLISRFICSGEISSETQFGYDAFKRLIVQRQVTGYNQDIRSKYYEYDNQGNLVKEYQFPESPEINHYDASGRLISCIDYENGEITRTEAYQYNSSGKLSRMEVRQCGGLWVTTYEYDDKGFLILEKETDRDGRTLDTYDKYTYDKYGNCISHRCFKAGELTPYLEYKYIFEYYD